MADKQGFLTKEGEKIKSWKRRWCVLRAGAIYYSKKQNSSELGIISVPSVTLVRPSNYKKKKSCFEVWTPERTFYFVADSDAERDLWVGALNTAKKQIEDRNKTPVSPNTANANAAANAKISIKDFDLLHVVGKGSFGTVMQVRKKDTGKIFAMKVLNKKTIIERKEEQHTRAEKNIMQTLAHPFLVNLNYAFQTEDKLYFIMDFINGGEIFFHLQKEEKFSNERVRFYSAEIACGLEYIHNCGVLYRDLKPENILLTNDGHICLMDFGISKEGMMSDNDRTTTFCGTPEYLAPEILKGQQYGKAIDWWAFGTLMFEMLTGLPPFYSQNVQEMYTKIMNDRIVFPPHIGPDARNLITALLERNPDRRLQDPKLIKAHPYFKDIDWAKIVAKEVTPPFIPNVLSEADVSQVDAEFLATTPKLSMDDGSNLSSTMQENFAGFTYVGTSEHLK